jgi:Icc-related predicted phosphoesterase
LVRIAATADLHMDRPSVEHWKGELARVSDDADLLLLGGDLTQNGVASEADCLVDALAGVSVPICAVLGNHDLNARAEDAIQKILERRGVVVLEGRAAELQVRGLRVGVAGTIGFGGGFDGACATDFGELEMKSFVGRSQRLADRLELALAELDSDLRIVLLHYAPIPETLAGEPREIYPFLGSQRLGEAIDRRGADLVLHGHAHRGSERGTTPRGVEVRNVAQPVTRAAYRLFQLGERTAEAPQVRE